MYKVRRRFGDNNGLECMNGDYLSCSNFYNRMKEGWKDCIIREDDNHFVYMDYNGKVEAYYLVSCEPAPKVALIRLYDTLSNRFNGKVNRIAKVNLSMTEIEMINNLGLIEVNEKTTIREVLRALRQYLKIK